MQTYTHTRTHTKRGSTQRGSGRSFLCAAILKKKKEKKKTVNPLPLYLSPLLLQPKELAALLLHSSLMAFFQTGQVLIKKQQKKFLQLVKRGKRYFRINWNAVAESGCAENHVVLSQTHKSKAENHMLPGRAVLPTCCLTLLISLHIFICFTIGKSPALITDRILWETGVYCISYSSWFCVWLYLDWHRNVFVSSHLIFHNGDTHDFIFCGLNFILDRSSGYYWQTCRCRISPNQLFVFSCDMLLMIYVLTLSQCWFNYKWVFNLLNFHTFQSLLDTGFFLSFIDSLTVRVSRLLWNISPEGIPYGLLFSVCRHTLKNLICTWPCGLPSSHTVIGPISK